MATRGSGCHVKRGTLPPRAAHRGRLRRVVKSKRWGEGTVTTNTRRTPTWSARPQLFATYCGMPRRPNRRTPASRNRLLERSALGDKASQDRLVAGNLEMVIRVADARSGEGLSTPDLVQGGLDQDWSRRCEPSRTARRERLRPVRRAAGWRADGGRPRGGGGGGRRDAELHGRRRRPDYERTQKVLRRELHRGRGKGGWEPAGKAQMDDRTRTR